MNDYIRQCNLALSTIPGNLEALALPTATPYRLSAPLLPQLDRSKWQLIEWIYAAFHTTTGLSYTCYFVHHAKHLLEMMCCLAGARYAFVCQGVVWRKSRKRSPDDYPFGNPGLDEFLARHVYGTLPPGGDFHCWISFDNGEVFDLTILASVEGVTGINFGFPGNQDSPYGYKPYITNKAVSLGCALADVANVGAAQWGAIFMGELVALAEQLHSAPCHPAIPIATGPHGQNR